MNSLCTTWKVKNDWPSQLPNGNPIENVWAAELKETVPLLSLYDVLEIADRQNVIKKQKHCEDNHVFTVCYEDLFNVLYEAYIAVGHGGKDKMIHALQTKYDVWRCFTLKKIFSHVSSRISQEEPEYKVVYIVMVIDAGLEGIVDAFGIKAKKNKFSKIDKIRMYVRFQIHHVNVKDNTQSLAVENVHRFDPSVKAHLTQIN
ncbi:hypothetical protein ILUMI_22566 [Ignelater luminosus]|uniref:Uncharacterized protein n=1 Tax=Ignelater luminosus TaxID=2038154 RepID=A0A8K0CAE1_IGNLU|nr:hypothetical protein ILUMI_22566 [Ignelater luminosus]